MASKTTSRIRKFVKTALISAVVVFLVLVALYFAIVFARYPFE